MFESMVEPTLLDAILQGERTLDGAFDFEASGLDSASQVSFPIAYGYFCRGLCGQDLIKPAKSWSGWSLEAEGLHQITLAQLWNYGQAADQVCASLNRQLAGAVLICDSDYDVRWLRRLYLAGDSKPAFQLVLVQQLLDGPDMDCWEENLVEQFTRWQLRRHWALNDALIQWQVFNALWF